MLKNVRTAANAEEESALEYDTDADAKRKSHPKISTRTPSRNEGRQSSLTPRSAAARERGDEIVLPLSWNIERKKPAALTQVHNHEVKAVASSRRTRTPVVGSRSIFRCKRAKYSERSLKRNEGNFVSSVNQINNCEAIRMSDVTEEEELPSEQRGRRTIPESGSTFPEDNESKIARVNCYEEKRRPFNQESFSYPSKNFSQRNRCSRSKRVKELELPIKTSRSKRNYSNPSIHAKNSSYLQSYGISLDVFRSRDWRSTALIVSSTLQKVATGAYEISGMLMNGLANIFVQNELETERPQSAIDNEDYPRCIAKKNSRCSASSEYRDHVECGGSESVHHVPRKSAKKFETEVNRTRSTTKSVDHLAAKQTEEATDLRLEGHCANEDISRVESKSNEDESAKKTRVESASVGCTAKIRGKRYFTPALTSSGTSTSSSSSCSSFVISEKERVEDRERRLSRGEDRENRFPIKKKSVVGLIPKKNSIRGFPVETTDPNEGIRTSGTKIAPIESEETFTGNLETYNEMKGNLKIERVTKHREKKSRFARNAKRLMQGKREIKQEPKEVVELKNNMSKQKFKTVMSESKAIKGNHRERRVSVIDSNKSESAPYEAFFKFPRLEYFKELELEDTTPETTPRSPGSKIPRPLRRSYVIPEDVQRTMNRRPQSCGGGLGFLNRTKSPLQRNKEGRRATAFANTPSEYSSGYDSTPFNRAATIFTCKY